MAEASWNGTILAQSDTFEKSGRQCLFSTWIDCERVF